MAIWKDDARHESFFAAVEALLDEYPELAAGDDDEEVDAILDGYDPASPKVVSGIVVLVAHGNLDGWSELTYTAPPHQSHYLTVGMLYKALRLCESK